MHCPNCRNQVNAGAPVCPHCGITLEEGAGNAQVMADTMPMVIDQAEAVDRATFIRRTYTHMAVAILAFIIVESMLYKDRQ